VLSFSTVYAIGVARPYFFNNTILLDKGQSYDVAFQVQNGENVSKSIGFTVKSTSPMQINSDGQDFVTDFTLGPRSRSDIGIEFMSNTEGRYEIKYAVKEIQSDSGLVFDFSTGDSFFIQVGNRTNVSSIGINLTYPGFTLLTDSVDITDAEDLVIMCPQVEVDFTGRIVDLTSFRPEYVQCGSKSIYLNTTWMPSFSQRAVIRFYSVKSLYTIYNNGSECSLSNCKFISYQSKRLSFEVPKFNGNYSIIDKAEEPSITIPIGSSKSSSSTSGGVIPPRNTTSVAKNLTNITSVSTTKPKNITINEPVQDVPKQKILPIVNQQNTTKNQTSKVVVPQKAKTLLTSMLILGLVSFVAGCGVLFYYINSRGVDNE
jgi:hypothetical protein